MGNELEIFQERKVINKGWSTSYQNGLHRYCKQNNVIDVLEFLK